MLTVDFMPRGSVSHVLAGLDERAGLVVDELDAATEWSFELDPKHHAIATKRLQETSRQEQMFKPQKQEQRRLAL